MSDDEEQYKVCTLVLYFNLMMPNQISLKARAGPQQRYLAKDIFGSDSELSDAPDADGTKFRSDQTDKCHTFFLQRKSHYTRVRRRRRQKKSLPMTQ